MIPLTKNAADALNASSSCARQFGHDHVGCEHIFLAILALPNSQGAKRLVTLGYVLEELTQSMRDMISSEASSVMQRGPLPMSARTRKVIEMSGIEAGKGKPVGTEHLILAMLREGENIAAQLMFNSGITLEKYLAAGTQGAAAKGKTDDPAGGEEPADGEADAAEEENEDSDNESSTGENGKQQKTPTVNGYGRDLTDLARQGKLDPVIGRTKELQRLVQILSRRTKNNAVLVGEAGVGKTAVVEGLAQAIHRGEVPERMQNKRVVAIDMARVVAGTQYRGQFEERLKRIIDETKRSGNIILFLDEIHTLVGAGGAEGAMDAANILKPALARGELQCVGATTLKEYHKSIERDAALERRFQSVMVEEPSIADAIDILTGIAPNYEQYHSVKYAPEALRAAVELTARYLPARLLPDKAIDALDETGARLRARVSQRPKKLTAMQEEIDSLRGEKEEAVNHHDFDHAAAIRTRIAETAQKLAEAVQKWKETHAEQTLDVTADDVAQTVSLVSGVPVEKMSANTVEKLRGMEKALGEIVVGQQEAIVAVSRALRRSRAFLADPKRPIGSFLFLGPTGVGKTHLAKMLAERIYGDEKALISIDMSEYQEKYSSSRLVGAPPGYVGHDEGGQLTEKVRRRPYSVVLFDEFEKADADVCNMLLQILDDGRLTDGQGRVVDFRNTIIICTANLGFDFAREGHTLGFARDTAETSYDMLREKLMAEAKRTFRPELLNRFDEQVVFRKLEKESLGSILDLELAKLGERLGKIGLKLTLEAKAKTFLVARGFDSALGARPLRRIVQQYVEDPLADLVLSDAPRGQITGILANDGKSLTYKIKESKPRRLGNKL